MLTPRGQKKDLRCWSRLRRRCHPTFGLNYSRNGGFCRFARLVSVRLIMQTGCSLAYLTQDFILYSGSWMDDFVPAELKPEVELPKKSFWKRVSLKQKVSLIGLGILFVGLPVVMGAVKIQQELRSKASSPPPPSSIPIIKTEVLATATVKTAYQAQVEGYDPVGPGAALSLTISNLPAGLSQGPCQITPISTPIPTPTPTTRVTPTSTPTGTGGGGGSPTPTASGISWEEAQRMGTLALAPPPQGCTINARIMVSADGTNFSDASGTTVTLPQGTTRLYFKGVNGATGRVSANVTARMVWKGDAYKGTSFANEVGQESIPGPDGYPTRFEAYENTGDPQSYLAETCVNRGGVTVSTISPTPTCVPPPDCIGGEPKNDGRLYCALMGAPPPGTVYCPTPTPTTKATPTPIGCRYMTPDCPPGTACTQQVVWVCPTPTPLPTKLTPTITPVPPAGCYYQQVKCIQEPCNPVLVCPTPTPIQPATITCTITGTPTTAGTYSVGAVLSNSKTGLVGRKTLSLSVAGPATPTPTVTKYPTPTACYPPPSCPNPPEGCIYQGGSCSSCGTLICTTPTPPSYIQVLTPNGGEQLTVGQSYTIQWQSSPGIANYLIYLVNSLGQESLVNGVSAPNTSYTWRVDSAIMQNTGLHKIKIVDAAQGGVGSATQDLSDNFFTINSSVTTPTTTPTPTTKVTPTPTPISVTPTPTTAGGGGGSPTPTTTSAPTVTVTAFPTSTTTPTPTPTPQYWWYRFFRPAPTPPRPTPQPWWYRFFRPAPTPTRTPAMGIQ